MRQSENKRAPSLGGWVIGAAAGLIAAAVAYVVGEFSYTQAGFIGAVVFLLAGLILGMYWGATATAPKPAVAAAAVAPAEVVKMPAVSVVPQIIERVTLATAPVASGSVSGPAAMFTSSPTAGAAPAKPARVAKPKVAVKAASKSPAAKVAKAPKVAKPAGPIRLTGPREGKVDDLKEIEGIGPALEKLCHSLGFYHFDQIAGWSEGDVSLVDAEMKTFKGRIVRDKWVSQAKIIVTEGLEAFRVRAKTNNY